MTRLVLSREHINSHIGIEGATGSGKSLLVDAILRNIRARGDVAIVWDPEREHARKHRSIERGDTILDPTCTECPYWAVNREYKDEGEAMSLSSCFFPDNKDVKDPFWNNSARGLLTVINAVHHPTISDLGFWCADDFEIDRRVAGTEYERILTNNAPGMRSSIISHLNQIAQPLRMMPQHPEGLRTFTIRDWCETRRGWVFITSHPSYMAICNPLHTFFLSSFIQRLVAMGPRRDLPNVWVILQEASTIMVQELHMGLIRLRKARTPVVYALQSVTDMKPVLGERTEGAMSQPYYRFYFRLNSDEAAKKASATIGKKTVRRLKMTWSEDHGKRHRSFEWVKEEVAVVPENVLLNLPDCVFYATSPGKITSGTMPIMEMPDSLPALEDRVIPPMIRRLPLQEQPIAPVDITAEPSMPLIGHNYF